MTPTQASRTAAILRLRLLIAFLGENKQHGWWDTAFLDATGRRFLETTFPRTAFEAALRCTSEAARLIHDGQIGRRGAFHLFRLPIEVEDAIESRISQSLDPDWLALVADKEAATRELLAMATTRVTAPAGPVQVGTEKTVLSPDSASDMAAHYHSAFAERIRCYPYFASAPNVRR
ncbi:MAG: BrxE family protein [Vicinamibacterales bacterium]